MTRLLCKRDGGKKPPVPTPLSSSATFRVYMKQKKKKKGPGSVKKRRNEKPELERKGRSPRFLRSEMSPLHSPRGGQTLPLHREKNEFPLDRTRKDPGEERAQTT